MFGKLFESTYTGSLVGAGIAVHAVWPYVIAHTKHGVVELNPDMLAAQFGGVTPEQVSEAIEYLCSADPRSRNQSEDGRRMIREGAFQYRVVNHEHYRSMRDDADRREYNRVKKQESRARKAGQTKSQTCQPPSAQPEAEAEAENIGSSPAVAGGPGEVSHSAAPAKPTKPKKPRKVKCQIRDDWAPSLGNVITAQKLGIDLESEASKFRDYCLANAKTYADWDAAFRNWLRNSLKFSNGSNGSPRKPRDEPLPGQVGWKRPGRKNGVSELHQQYIDRKAVEDEKRAQKANPGPANGITEDDIPY